MGMTLQVTVSAADATAAADEANHNDRADHADDTNGDEAGDIDATYNPAAEPDTGFTSRERRACPAA